MQHTTSTELQIAQTIPCTEAEGPGKRFAIWFQGCPFRCPGCCNPEMLAFKGGTATSLESMIDDILQAKAESDIEGITLIGGEPFAHALGAGPLAERVRAHGLTVMIFTGYVLEELQSREEPEIAHLLAHTDLLVDGLYDRTQPETQRRWIGSKNQRIHFLSDRYDENDPQWTVPNTLEIRLIDDEITINGFPAGDAVGLWKRIDRSSGE